MTPIHVPEKLPGENGRQYAYRVLFDAIMTLEFPPGMLLVDAELSQALHISRTPIREAIVSLTESKLVDVHPQKSSSVSRIDLDAVDPAYLDERELAMLNAYHARVYELLVPELTEEERGWLETYTAPLQK